MSNDGLGSNPQAGGFSLSAIAVAVAGVAYISDSVGFLQFQSTRFIATGTGNVTIKVTRYGGSTGAISGAITQVDCNRSSGKYNPVSIPVIFADGEVGDKTFNFNITTAPTDGPYWINLILNTGPFAIRHNTDVISEITVNDGVSIPSIDTTNIFVVAKTGNDSNDGSLANPWLTIQKAVRTVTAGSLVFIRAGTYTEHVREEDPTDWTGGWNPLYPATRDNQTIIMNYPGEAPILDQNPGVDYSTDLTPYAGFKSWETQVSPQGPISGWRWSGLTMRNCSFVFDGVAQTEQVTKRYNRDLIFEDLDMMGQAGAQGTNPGMFFLSGCKGVMVRNCDLSYVYEDYQLHIGSHGNNACIHGYHYTDTVIEDNTMDYAAHLVYNKAPPPEEEADNNTGMVIRRNKFGVNTTTAIRFEAGYSEASIGTFGTWRHKDIDIYHNIFEGGAIGTVVFGFFSATSLWIFNNIFQAGMGGLSGFLDTQVYNNIVINTSPDVAEPLLYAGSGMTMGIKSGFITPEQNEIDGTFDIRDPASFPVPGDGASTLVMNPGVLEYFDYNVYSPNAKWVLSANDGVGYIFTTLAQWQVATHYYQMPIAGSDLNGSMFNPVLDVNGRPTVTVPLGRFGLISGVPDSITVGGTL